MIQESWKWHEFRNLQYTNINVYYYHTFVNIPGLTIKDPHEIGQSSCNHHVVFFI